MTAKNGKPCKKCGANDWYKSGQCKPCAIRRTREWKAANPDSVKVNDKKWRENNKGKLAAKNKEWRENNKEKVAAKNAEWRENNREKCVEYVVRWQQKNQDWVKKYRQDNKDKLAAKNKEWKEKNRSKTREYSLKWYYGNHTKALNDNKIWARENPDKVRVKRYRRKTRKTKAGGSFTATEWKQLCNQYNNRCLKCGEKKKLTVDHVIPIAMGGTSDINNIQPLCGPCNSSKGATAKDYRTKQIIERWIPISIFDILIDGEHYDKNR